MSLIISRTQATCSATLVYTPGLPPTRPHSASPKLTMPRTTSRPAALLAVSPPPLSPLQLSATALRLVLASTSCCSPAAQIWDPVSGHTARHSSGELTRTDAVCTVSGCARAPVLGLMISPKPVTSAARPSAARKESAGPGRQMGTVVVLYMSTSRLRTSSARSCPARMSLSLALVSQPGCSRILSTATPPSCTAPSHCWSHTLAALV